MANEMYGEKYGLPATLKSKENDVIRFMSGLSQITQFTKRII